MPDKELLSKQMQLANLIMDFAIKEKMSYREVEVSFGIVKQVFLSDGLVIRD